MCCWGYLITFSHSSSLPQKSAYSSLVTLFIKTIWKNSCNYKHQKIIVFMVKTQLLVTVIVWKKPTKHHKTFVVPERSGIYLFRIFMVFLLLLVYCLFFCYLWLGLHCFLVVLHFYCVACISMLAHMYHFSIVCLLVCPAVFLTVHMSVHQSVLHTSMSCPTSNSRWHTMSCVL